MNPEISGGSTRAAASRSPATSDEAAEVRRWVGVLTQGWAILLAGAVAGAILGALAAARTIPSYEAEVVLNLDAPEDDQGPLTARGLRPLLLNPGVATRVVREVGLDAPPFSLTGPRFLSDFIRLESIPNTNLLRLTVRARDAEKAAEAARLMAVQLEDLTARVWGDSLKGRVENLEPQVARARDALRKAEEAWKVAAGARSGVVPSRPPSRDKESPSGRTPDHRAAGDFELLGLEHEVAVSREVYMDLAEDFEHARIEYEARPKPLRVVDPPTVPSAPVPGARSRTIALGLIAGLILGGCVVVAREWRGSGS